MTKSSLFLGVKSYIKNNIEAKNKILISISCGLDSTVLLDLIKRSEYFKNKNIYYLIFDHQKRSEGKYEIKQFIKFYNLANKNLYIKKIPLKDKSNGFQERSRSSRYNWISSFTKKRNIKDIFLGHHLDDLNETFFLRKIQQSGVSGLSKIFLQKHKNIKLHRPLDKYTKKQIKCYADRKKLIWFEDRSNLEFEFTRNKIRSFLLSNNRYQKINRERLLFSEIFHLHNLHNIFFKRKRNKSFEIKNDRFNLLNENLKFFAVQSFYYANRQLIKKQIRDENIRNFIKTVRSHPKNTKEISVFAGKIGAFKKKLCINLT